MTTFAILHLLRIIEETDESRARYEWEKRYTPAHVPPENIEAREIRRLGIALQNIVTRYSNYNLRGY